MPLEKAMASHSGTLAWKIPWMEEPGGLQSMESRRVGHNWVTEQQQIVLCNILHGSSGCLNVGISSGLRVYDHLKTDKGRKLFSG